jgi:hypothetical protein
MTDDYKQSKYDWIGWPEWWLHDDEDDDEQLEADLQGYDSYIKFLENKLEARKNGTKKDSTKERE